MRIRKRGGWPQAVLDAVEKTGGRAKIEAALAETMRSHYDRLERIAADVERLGYAAAAKIPSAELPKTTTARSGDLGEILATELVEEEIGLRVPVRRLRYKDGRNMAMRLDRDNGRCTPDSLLDLAFGALIICCLRIR